MKYSTRLVAYIDILGFKQYIDNTVHKSGRDNKQAINYLGLTYKRMKRVFKPRWDHLFGSYSDIQKLLKNSKRVTVFSDSIIVSFSIEEKSILAHVLMEIERMQRELIWRGMICRGAVTIGKLIHTPSVVFGPALVEAYLIESKIAKVPRIVVDEKVVALIRKELSKKPTRRNLDYFIRLRSLNETLKQDVDGYTYFDYFSIHENEPPFIWDLGWLYLNFLSEIICDGLNLSEEPGKNHLFEKFNWMKEKYNDLAKFYGSEEFYSKYYRDNKFKDDNPDFESVRIIQRNPTE